MLLTTLLPAAILLMGALIITGAFVMTPNPGTEMERRINLVAAPMPGKSAGPIARAAKKEEGASFDARMRKLFSIGMPYRWGMRSSGFNLLLVSTVSGLAVFYLMAKAVGFPWWLAAPPGALAAFLVPRFILKRQQRAAENKFMDLFPDAIDTIVRMLRAGLPMTSAMRVVGEEGSPPVAAAFAGIADQVKIGIPLDQALEAASKDIGLPDFRFFAVAVLLQFSAGGNIAATLDLLSGIMRKRRAVRLKARSATAEIRLTAYLLGSLPFATIAILLLIQPRYLDPLFADPRGHVILGMAGGGLFMSFLTMRQMMRSVLKG